MVSHAAPLLDHLHGSAPSYGRLSPHNDPTLAVNGLPPAGIRDASLDEVLGRFGQIQGTDWRATLGAPHLEHGLRRGPGAGQLQLAVMPERSAVRAGRIMLEEIGNHVRAGRSFAFETTLSGRLYARWIPGWRRRGYRVKLIYLKVSSAELALSRVRARVLQGGHGVPADVVVRRFEAGWRNFERVYKPLVDAWILYDNSGDTPVVLDAEEKR